MMHDKRLTFLVTGAGSGLGRGLSQQFAQAGHDVLVTDVDLAATEETIAQAATDAARMTAVAVDVTSDASIQQLGSLLDTRPVDILVNNAGLQHVDCLEEFPQEQWDRLINVMLQGTARMTRVVLPGMRDRRFGRIINIGSIHSLVASPYKSAYVAAKHGLLGFSKVIALETADADITINTICPAYIRTPLIDAQIADQARQHGISEEDVIETIMLEPMPKKAFITVEEIAGTIEFLVSAAARNITGQTITIDGGWTIR